MLVSAFITHKEAERFSDCQDRFSINTDTKSIAVSDGMSQSVFQKYWAQILVDKYANTIDWVPNLESVRELIPLWDIHVNKFIEEEEKAGRNPWRTKRSIAEGRSAGATFLGVRFDKKSWVCEVLGDSCLILIRNYRIDKIITSEDVEVFDNNPDYYDSNITKVGKGKLKTDRGCFEDGDVILLVSDPFSDYLLKNKGSENEKILVDRLVGLNTHAEFEDLVSEWRKSGMHNDDSTLIIIKNDDSEELNLIDGSVDNLSDLIEIENSLSVEGKNSVVYIESKEKSELDNKIQFNEQLFRQELLRQIEESNLESYIRETLTHLLGNKNYPVKSKLKKNLPNLSKEIKNAIIEFFKK